MKITKLALVAVSAVIIIAACKSTKKSTASTAPAPTAAITPAPTATAMPRTYSMPPKPANAVYIPGDAELMAIQAQHKDVTLEKLKEGYTIYTQGACINCHVAMDIYRYSEPQWKGIIDDMARKAMMGNEQKDAVYKYVLAVKATQPR